MTLAGIMAAAGEGSRRCVTIRVSMPRETWLALNALCVKRSLSKSQAVRDAITTWMKRRGAAMVNQ